MNVRLAIGAGLAAALLGGCAVNDMWPDSLALHSVPLNDHPEQAIVVRVKAPSTLTVALYAQYAPTSAALDCRGMLSGLEGTSGAMDRPVELKPLGGGAYEARAYADAVLPGACAWRFVGIAQRVSKVGASSMTTRFLRAPVSESAPAPRPDGLRRVYRCYTSRSPSQTSLQCPAEGDGYEIEARAGDEVQLTYFDDDKAG
jgi:hypothetical protein